MLLGRRHVRPGDRHSIVRLLTRRRTNMVVQPVLWGRGHGRLRGWRRRQTLSLEPFCRRHFRRRAVYLDWWCLQSERRSRGIRLRRHRCKLHRGARTSVRTPWRVDRLSHVRRESGRARCLDARKARRVRCRLRAQLSKVQIGTGTVPGVHRFPEPVLRPEAVEDDPVNHDDNDLDNDLNDATD